MRQVLVRGMAGLAVLVFFLAVLPTATFAAPQAAPHAQGCSDPSCAPDNPLPKFPGDPGGVIADQGEIGGCDYSSDKPACQAYHASQVQPRNLPDVQRPFGPSLVPTDPEPNPGRTEVSTKWTCETQDTMVGTIFRVYYSGQIRQVGMAASNGYIGEIGTTLENSVRVSLGSLGLGKKPANSTITPSLTMDGDGACLATSCKVLPGSP